MQQKLLKFLKLKAIVSIFYPVSKWSNFNNVDSLISRVITKPSDNLIASGKFYVISRARFMELIARKNAFMLYKISKTW